MQTADKHSINTNLAEQVDIAIVGAGMVGAALAACLAGSRYRIALIDGQPASGLNRSVAPSSIVNNFEPRVSALTSASQDLLQEAGAWQYMDQQLIQPYRKMIVWDELGTGEISFDAADIHQDALGCIVENQTIVSALHVRLGELTNIHPVYGQKITSITSSDVAPAEHVLQFDNGQTLSCRLLVAADGAMSRIRQWAAIPTREWDYQHEAIVCTVETEKKHDMTALQRFSESGPLAFLPLADEQAGQRFCSIVWSQETSRARYLVGLDDAAFLAELEQSIEARLGRLVAVSARHAIPLRQRHAKGYVKPGLVLVGDAAHTIHPLAGQGVNLGFKDVKVLSDLLKMAEARNLDVNDALLLKRYQRQRQGDNLLMMAAMEGFKRLFAQPDPLVRWLRNTGMEWVNGQRFLKNQLARHAMGLPF